DGEYDGTRLDCGFELPRGLLTRGVRVVIEKRRAPYGLAREIDEREYAARLGPGDVRASKVQAPPMAQGQPRVADGSRVALVEMLILSKANGVSGEHIFSPLAGRQADAPPGRRVALVCRADPNQGAVRGAMHEHMSDGLR